MPKKLNTDGLPVDVPTVNPADGQGLFRGLAPNPRDRSTEEQEGQGRHEVSVPLDPPTKPAQHNRGDSESRLVRFSTDEPRTVIAAGARRKIGEPAHEPAPTDPMSDPVVGWLVIVDGPGKGAAIRLGNGQNTLGRGAKARARVDFGDRQISRDSHAVVAYDPKHNRFYIYQGTGTNLTYLDGKPVLSPTELITGNIVSLGATTLRFVALCDDTFVWEGSDSPA